MKLTLTVRASVAQGAAPARRLHPHRLATSFSRASLSSSVVFLILILDLVFFFVAIQVFLASSRNSFSELCRVSHFAVNSIAVAQSVCLTVSLVSLELRERRV